jgi:broad specificity phosphatase PhoE
MMNAHGLAPTRISFVRHGEVDNPERIYYGRLPGFGLTLRGRREARAAARALDAPPPDVLYSSPLLRALQTARLLHQAYPEIRLCISALLSEACTPYDGQPRRVLDAIRWNVYEGTLPPWEQPLDLLARTRRFIAQVRAEHPGRHIVAVTHGDIVAFTLLWAGDLPVTAEGRRAVARLGVAGGYPAHASISTLMYRTNEEKERPEVTYLSVGKVPARG